MCPCGSKKDDKDWCCQNGASQGTVHQGTKAGKQNTASLPEPYIKRQQNAKYDNDHR